MENAADSKDNLDRALLGAAKQIRALKIDEDIETFMDTSGLAPKAADPEAGWAVPEGYSNVTDQDTKTAYNPTYRYTFTINYNRNYTPPSGGGDGGDDDDDTTTIPDNPVPLAPKPEELFTILDEDVPLGDLPKTGGNSAAAAGLLGLIALAGGAFLKRKNRNEEDSEG